jgi:outer membrane protein OmpA-like peptidoglycan-associated protein
MASADCGAAFAQHPNEAQILEALRPKHTRSLVPLTPDEQRKAEEDQRFIDELRSHQKARSLSPREQETTDKITANKPSVDLEVQFEYNSDAVTPEGRKFLQTLGHVLTNDQLKGMAYFINGHTDAKGGTDYNQGLSQRRAEAVKRVLVEEFRVPADNLIAIGYGKTKLKNPADPLAGENRRVQVVNTEQQATAAKK